MENPSKQELLQSIASRMTEIKSLEYSMLMYERRLEDMRERIKDLKNLISLDVILIRELKDE